jgi:hypothetical protein
MKVLFRDFNDKVGNEGKFKLAVRKKNLYEANNYNWVKVVNFTMSEI